MPKRRVHAMAMSLDGYVAGPDQDLDHPLGVGGPRLHEWVFETRTGRQMIGEPGGDEGAAVRLGGGAATIQDYLRAGLLDELHVAIVPVLLGGGERLFDAVGGGADGYECVDLVAGASVVHARLARKG